MSVKCGNRRVHGTEKDFYHETPADVFACFQGGAQRPQAQPKSASAPAELPHSISVKAGVLHKGYFTVVFEDGTRRTLRLRRQAKDDSFKPGVMLVSLLTGPDNTASYTNVGEVYENRGIARKVRVWRKHQQNELLLEAVRVLCGDPQAAAKAYAQESDRCSKCNHELTVPQGPKSQHLNPYRDDGYGPDCGEEILGKVAA